MNPQLATLQSYPFQKLTALLTGNEPPAGTRIIPLHIGEPKHPTPGFIKDRLVASLGGLSQYPLTAGSDALRAAIGEWIKRRYGITGIDTKNEILPVNGSREALFAFGQAIIDRTRPNPTVVSPNPFYQIYEGAALLAGAQPRFLNTLPASRYELEFDSLTDSEWADVQLAYVCSPNNPTGHVMPLSEWKRLFELSDRHGFVIASDECYSEIYFDESMPPLGAMQAARELGRSGFERLVVFSSLSKRSNVPGMRSGFVAGDATILGKFLLYRTYHGCAMNPAVQDASVVAWQDEAHVIENRRLYREKFDAVLDILGPVMDVQRPDAAFYLWAGTPGDDQVFARELYRTEGVSVLPGSYLAREVSGINPGANRIRIALVASTDECVEASRRIRNFITTKYR